jgi:hypothetical protein
MSAYSAKGAKSRNAVDPMAMRLEGPSPEVRISGDIAKRGLIAAPVLLAVAGLIWGSAGVWSSAYGLALVLANFAGSAALIAVAARISVGFLMGATLFGYLIRLAIIFVAVWIVKDAAWISIPALGATIIVTHLGLLFWELKYVAISLSHSGIEADRPSPTP